MSTNKFWMTAQIPSTFGMPAYGRALGVSLCATGVTSSVVGDGHIVDAAQRLVTAGFPGTSAWRPPIC